MSACEKCWSDAGGSALRYADLMIERHDHTCTAEQQAGLSAKECPICKRLTIHEITGEAMCGCRTTNSEGSR